MKTSFAPKSYSKIYRNFKEIELGAHRAVVRFYEEYEKDIRELNFEESFELMIAYLDALFEIGAYGNFLGLVNHAIEEIITNNIKIYQGEDIFEKILFRKAAAHYNLMQYAKSDHILRELIRMNPENELAARFLKRCDCRLRPRIIKNSRAFSVLLFVLSAVVIAFEVLLVRPFFNMYEADIMTVRNLLFLSGVVVLVVGDVAHRLAAEQRVNQFVRTIKARKSKKTVE